MHVRLSIVRHREGRAKSGAQIARFSLISGSTQEHFDALGREYTYVES